MNLPRYPLFWEAISPRSEVCSVNISRPDTDVAEWSVHDPGCVKTHTSGKCRKYNSPAWHPTACPQHYQFSWRAIPPRCFYARGGRWSSRAASTPSRHSGDPPRSLGTPTQADNLSLSSGVLVPAAAGLGQSGPAGVHTRTRHGGMAKPRARAEL